MHIIKNEYLQVSKNEYLHENNQNLNKNGYGNNGGENGGFTGGIKKAPGERPLSPRTPVRLRTSPDRQPAVRSIAWPTASLHVNK